MLPTIHSTNEVTNPKISLQSVEAVMKKTNIDIIFYIIYFLLHTSLISQVILLTASYRIMMSFFTALNLDETGCKKS